MAERRRSPLTMPSADPHTCTVDVRMRVLGSVPYFADLSAEDLVDVNARADVRGFDEGAPIYHAGAAATHLYVVATGTVKLTRVNADGQETLLDLLIPGDHLGSLPALGNRVYPDSAWALTPACLLVFGTRDFEAVLHRHRAVALATLGVIADQLADTRDHVHDLSSVSVERVLAGTLLRLADRIGEPWEEPGLLLQVPLTREDLAGMTGARPETVSRILATWRRDGLITTGRRWIAIRDRSALEAKAEA
jgi:CRP-like cAMP-binding protein